MPFTETRFQVRVYGCWSWQWAKSTGQARDLLPPRSSCWSGKWRPRSWPIRLYTMSHQRAFGRNSVRVYPFAETCLRTESRLCRRRDRRQPRNLKRSPHSLPEQVPSTSFQARTVQHARYQRSVFGYPLSRLGAEVLWSRFQPPIPPRTRTGNETSGGRSLSSLWSPNPNSQLSFCKLRRNPRAYLSRT